MNVYFRLPYNYKITLGSEVSVAPMIEGSQFSNQSGFPK